MQNPHLINWTENFTQNISSSALLKSGNHGEVFLHDKLLSSATSLKKVCENIHSANEASAFYNQLCVFIQEAKNCMYWYERSLEVELVNSENAHSVLEQGKCMIEVLESTLRVIKYQLN